MNGLRHILVTDTEGLVVITLNRPAALNALNSATIEDLWQVIDHFDKVSALRGIIITGAGGKAFAAGADISEFGSLTNVDDFVRRGHRLFDRIERYRRPVVAAVNGFALGAGCELAMACHMRIAALSARFGQPEIKLGIIPGYGGSQRLVRLIGRGKGLELLLTGDMIGPDEAMTLGLVNHVTESGKEVELAAELIGRISNMAPLAIEETIRVVDASYGPNRDGFEAEIEGFVRLSGTHDFQEGSQAFLEKRRPKFEGR